MMRIPRWPSRPTPSPLTPESSSSETTAGAAPFCYVLVHELPRMNVETGLDKEADEALQRPQGKDVCFGLVGSEVGPGDRL